MNTSTKPRFSRHDALMVASEICAILKPVCERVIVAGSLRRKKQWVGDVEILFIPKTETGPCPDDLFAMKTVSLAQVAIDGMRAANILAPRLNKDGGTCWGDKNKLALHAASGVPVDLFSATEENWFNYLVCRTGSAAHNVTIATRANQLGWKWNPYGSGFTQVGTGKCYQVASEEDLFRFLDMQFKDPQDR